MSPLPMDANATDSNVGTGPSADESSTIHIDVQFALDQAGLPPAEHVREWALGVLHGRVEEGELGIRVVDEAECRQLNHRYRHKDAPTNVLSFPYQAGEGQPLPIPLLGDIIVCAPVVASQAAQQGKSLEAHFAHMVVHGVFHLLGYEHHDPADAERMEALEVGVLRRFGFPDPYAPGVYGYRFPVDGE